MIRGGALGEWDVCLLYFFAPLVAKRPPKDHIAARVRVAHTHHTHQARAVCHVTRQDNKTDAPPEAHPQQTNGSVGDCRPNQQSEHASTTERRLNHPTARRGACAKWGMARATRRMPKDTRKITSERRAAEITSGQGNLELRCGKNL